MFGGVAACAEDPDAGTDAGSDAGIDAGNCPQAPVIMGTAANFTVMGGTTVTNSGVSSVVGNVGVSPGSAIVGFVAPTTWGSIHANDATVVKAHADLIKAYNDAAARNPSCVMILTDLAAATLTPGVYRSNAAMTISGGSVTLDAQGDENAVFIFQVAMAFGTGASTSVVLANGTNPANVFWQVGSDVTFGATTKF